MSFHDVVLPAGIQYGSASGAGFATVIQETASGHEVRIARQSQGRHRLRLIKALQTSAEAAALKTFGLERRGAEHSFKVTDEKDFTTASDGQSAEDGGDSLIGSGDGVKTGPYQLIKKYGIVNPYIRTITLPVPGTVKIKLDAISTTAFTVNGSGQVTFDTPPGNGIAIFCGCQFYVPVRFGLGFDQWAQLQADAFGVWSLPDLDVFEVLDEVENPERRQPDGGKDWGAVSASFRVAFNDGCFHHVNPSVAISAILPPPSRCPGGHEVFVFSVYTGAAGSLQVRDDVGTAIGAALTAGQVRTVHLAINASGGATWVLG
jgi:uncharacterized protein (TIGR02217 family)